MEQRAFIRALYMAIDAPGVLSDEVVQKVLTNFYALIAMNGGKEKDERTMLTFGESRP